MINSDSPFFNLLNALHVQQESVLRWVDTAAPLLLNVMVCYRLRPLHLDQRRQQAMPWPIVAMETDKLDIVRLMLLHDNTPDEVLFDRIE